MVTIEMHKYIQESTFNIQDSPKLGVVIVRHPTLWLTDIIMTRALNVKILPLSALRLIVSLRF